MSTDPRRRPGDPADATRPGSTAGGRDYPLGFPYWIETLQPKPQEAAAFYAAVFGWDFTVRADGEAGEYYEARWQGRRVAGVGALTGPGAPPVALWNTRVRVGDVAAAAANATAAGGHVVRGPEKAPNGGCVAALGDPTGAVFSVWDGAGHLGAQVVNRPNTWQMSSLHTTHPRLAGEFYAALFEWRSEATSHEGPAKFYWSPDPAGPREVVAVLASTPPGVRGPSYWAVNFQVSSTDDISARVQHLGGRVLLPPVTGGRFRSAVLADAQGAAFSVSQPLQVGGPRGRP